MRNKTAKTIFLLSSISLLTVAVVFVILFSQITKKAQQLALLENDLETELSNEERLKSINQIVGDTQIERETLSSYFASPDGVVDFIDVIEEAATNAGVDLKVNRVGIRPSDELANDFFETLELELSATGSWMNVFHMITLLEKIPFATNLTKTTIERLPERTEAGDWISVTTLLVQKSK